MNRMEFQQFGKDKTQGQVLSEPVSAPLAPKPGVPHSEIERVARALSNGTTIFQEIVNTYPPNIVSKIIALSNTIDSERIEQIEARRFSEFKSVSTMDKKQWTSYLVEKIKNKSEAGEDIIIYSEGVKDGEKFSVHGVDGGSLVRQIDECVDLLEQGIPKEGHFYYTTYTKNPNNKDAHVSYKNGLFVLLASKNERLVTGCTHPNDSECFKLNTQTVIVNKAGYDLIDDLQKRYPHILFIRADEQALFFENYDGKQNSSLSKYSSTLENYWKEGRTEKDEEAFINLIGLLRKDHRFNEILKQYKPLIQAHPDETEEYESKAVKDFIEIYPELVS